jgi:hypothetical protein
MHRFLLVLLIALLPMRGWAAEAMATDMALHAAAQNHPTASGNAGTATDTLAADASAPCAGHEAPATRDHHLTHAKAAGEAGHADCETCAGCQTCHSPALAPSINPSSRPPHAGPPPAGVPASFTSAAPAPGFKPPIS